MSQVANLLLYSDFDFRFVGHPQTGRLVMRKNSDAITQAVKLLVMTNQLERPFRPLVGSTVRRNLFEPFGPMASEEIRTSITQAVTNYEPRAVLVDVKAVPDRDGARLDVGITYRPVNASKPVDVNFSLERLR